MLFKFSQIKGWMQPKRSTSRTVIWHIINKTHFFVRVPQHLSENFTQRLNSAASWGILEKSPAYKVMNQTET